MRRADARRPGQAPVTPARHPIARCTLGVLLSFTVQAHAASADTAPSDAAPLPSVDQLKRVYLDCEHHSQQGALPFSQAAYCSTVYEQLKARAFGGDFSRLHAWWFSATKGPAPEQPDRGEAMP